LARRLCWFKVLQRLLRVGDGGDVDVGNVFSLWGVRHVSTDFVGLEEGFMVIWVIMGALLRWLFRRLADDSPIVAKWRKNGLRFLRGGGKVRANRN
jgi:hypothetical protein